MDEAESATAQRVYSFFYAAEGKAALVTLSQCLTLSPRRLDAAVSEFKAESRARSECRSPSGDATGPQEGERRTNTKAFRGLLGAIRLLYGSSWRSRFDPGLKLRKRSPEERHPTKSSSSSRETRSSKQYCSFRDPLVKGLSLTLLPTEPSQFLHVWLLVFDGCRVRIRRTEWPCLVRGQMWMRQRVPQPSTELRKT